MNMINNLKKYSFLFGELVHRDFTKKYKRTFFGMTWSIISPLINLLIMWFVFGNILGNNVNHFVIYLFSGQLVFAFFSEATSMGMTSLVNNSSIFAKVNIPKYLFLFSQNVTSLINFCLTMIVYFIFVAVEGIPFTWTFLALLFPIVFLIIFNLGIGLILSALFVFFRDMQYLWGIISQLIMWLSAIFYTLDMFDPAVQEAFFFNPIYLFIYYFRSIVLDGTVPTVDIHIRIIIASLLAFGIGSWMYKHYNTEFLYYI